MCFEIAERKKVSYKACTQIKLRSGCIDSGEEIPGYISNPEVKLTCGEGSARGTECENSKMHPLYFKKALTSVRAFFFA